MDAESTKKTPRRYHALTAALIFFAMLAAAYLLAPQTIGEQARRSLLCLLQTHYKGMVVSIGSGRVSPSVGLILEDIEVTFPADSNRVSRRLLHIDRLIVETTVSMEKAIDGAMPFSARRMMAIGVDAHLWQQDDQKWSLAKLWPPPKMGPGCPRFEVYDGRLSVYSANGEDVSKVALRPIEFDKVRLSVLANHGTGSHASGHRFTMRASSEFVSQLALEGDVSPASMQLRGFVKELRIDPKVSARVPLLPAAAAKQLSGLTAITDVGFVVGRQGSSPIDFAAKWTFHDGRYQHPALPQAIERMRGVLLMRPDGVSVESAQGHFGESICTLSGATNGYSQSCDLSVRLVASNLYLNDRLTASLPTATQVALDKLRPRGYLDLDSRLHRSGGVWQADAVADLHGVDVNVDRFPYPVSQIIGKIHFRDSKVWTEQLSGRAGAQRIVISFLKPLPSSGGASTLRLAMDGPIPIDSNLLSGLTARGEPQSKLENFVRSLNPRGSVHLVNGQWDTSETGEKSHRMELLVSDGNLRYTGFPYALYDVAGRIVSENEVVRLIGFKAKNGDNASIKCEGLFENLANLVPRSPEGDWRVGLQFHAKDLPLDETIRAALPDETQQTWDALAPTGVLDSLEVEVKHASSLPAPLLTIAAKQTHRTIDQRTVSLRPTMLPYRLDVLEGSVRFDGNRVMIESLDARHDSTRLTADGVCEKTLSGQWQLDLNVRSGSRLHPDSELVNALPTQVRGAFQRLQLRGPLSIRGTTSILMPDVRHPDPTIDWGLTVQLEGNRIGDVGPVHSLRGELTVYGKRDRDSVTADGSVSIDSMHIEDKQVTSIHGPFAIRDDRLLLGETIALLGEPKNSVTSRSVALPIEGRMFGGVASLSGDVLLSNGNFDVTMAIREGDVATLLADLGETHSTVVGNVDGRVRLEGTVGASHLLKGAGSGKLTGANLYQVPILVQVFNMIRVKPSEAVAFTDGEVRFAIYGDQVTFNQIQLWGDLIALHGTGSMNRAKEVDLSFNTRVSPQNGWSQIMRPFGENQYTLWTINVKGPMSNPIIERRTLTTVNDTLERLFPGIAEPERPAGPISNGIDELRGRITR